MRYIVLALFLVGCGSEMTTQSDALTDTSWSTPATADACGASVTFGAGDFEWAYDCIQPDASHAGFTERGAYTVDGDSVTMSAREATCARDQIVPTLTDTFAIDGAAIHLSGGHGVMTLVRGGSVSSGLTLGCFEAKTGFVPHPLAPL